MNDLQQTHADFQTTRWSLLAALHSPDEAAQRSARSMLVECYWAPVYGWIRRKGLTQGEALEATQAFFTDVVISRRLFERADPSKKGLRAFMLSSLRNYLIDRRRRRDAGPGVISLEPHALELEDALISVDPHASPEAAFDRRWAMATVERALQRCERQYAGRRAAHHWKAFEACVLQPAIHGVAAPVRAQVASRLGFGDAASLTAAIHSVRLRLRAVLQQLVDEMTDDPEEAEREYQALLQTLGNG
jgi:DNA-directed RNA polymerase specialized sigma24 family protein